MLAVATLIQHYVHKDTFSDVSLINIKILVVYLGGRIYVFSSLADA